MKNHKLIILSITAILLSCLLAACSGGIPQEQYDQLKGQLTDALSQVTELQKEASDSKAENEALQSQLQAVQGQAATVVAGLQGEVSELKEQYELVGDTPAETAENIVRYYHETHTYSKVDFYVCSDMAQDVWNMLKAQEIKAVIQAGKIDGSVQDIAASDHAWVLAEVAPGEYLALETTAGYVVPKSENGLYYKGWSFANPGDFKQYSELRREYNVRVEVINTLVAAQQEAADANGAEVDKYNNLVDEYNSKYAGQPVNTESRILEAQIEGQGDVVEAGEAHFNHIKTLIEEQKAEASNIAAAYSSLAVQKEYN